LYHADQDNYQPQKLVLLQQNNINFLIATEARSEDVRTLQLHKAGEPD